MGKLWWAVTIAAGLILGTNAAFASDPFATGKGFSCGGADVEFDFVKRSDGSSEHVATVLAIRRDRRASVLDYDGNIDFIGGVCVHDKRNKPMVVFQAYCGGSACRNLDNWGIVDPADLRVLLVPNDWNRNDAQKILGRPLPVTTDSTGRQFHQIDMHHLYSTTLESQKLGMRWPSP